MANKRSGFSEEVSRLAEELAEGKGDSLVISAARGLAEIEVQLHEVRLHRFQTHKRWASTFAAADADIEAHNQNSDQWVEEWRSSISKCLEEAFRKEPVDRSRLADLKRTIEFLQKLTTVHEESKQRIRLERSSRPDFRVLHTLGEYERRLMSLRRKVRFALDLAFEKSDQNGMPR